MTTFNSKTAQMHLRMREIMAWGVARETFTSADIAQAFGLETYRVLRYTAKLTSLDLLVVDRAKTKKPGENFHTYKAVPYTQAALDRLLPTNKEMWRLSFDKFAQPELDRSSLGSNYVGRDPLDLLLMGDGEAPSLVFARNQNAEQAQYS